MHQSSKTDNNDKIIQPNSNIPVKGMTETESIPLGEELESCSANGSSANQLNQTTSASQPNIPSDVSTSTPHLPDSPMDHPEIPNSPLSNRKREDAPLIKLSVNLIKTYKHINEVYYEAKKKNQGLAQTSNNIDQQQTKYNNGYDDENYDYRIRYNERLKDQYVVKQKIGKGSFGQVIRAFDLKTKRDVAIKIIKSKRPFYKQAKTEVELLKLLNQSDPRDESYIVRLLDTFIHHKHQCLVFELLSYNLYDLLRKTNYMGVTLNLIRKFACQILQALYHLSRKEINIIHCDLKPENILLRHRQRSAIKVIDFGSSCRTDKRMYTYIQSRFYRSPEVLLGLPYSVSIDMWSLGCILVEMHTGEPLFSGADEHEQIIRFVAVLGMPPIEMLNNGSKTYLYFQRISRDGQDEYVLKPQKCATAEEEVLKHQRTLEDILGANGDGPNGRRKNAAGHSAMNYAIFVDLVKKMLCYDPEQRIKPHEALKHNFLIDQTRNTYLENNHSRKRFSPAATSTRTHRIKRPGSAPAKT